MWLSVWMFVSSLSLCAMLLSAVCVYHQVIASRFSTRSTVRDIELFGEENVILHPTLYYPELPKVARVVYFRGIS